MLVETFLGCPLLLRTISLDDVAPSLTRELAEQFLEDLGRSKTYSYQEFEGRR